MTNICFVKRFGSKWNRDKNEYTIVEMGLSDEKFLPKIFLPEEMTDYILSFSDAHVRADLNRKNISVQLKKNIIDIGDKLVLQNFSIYNQDGFEETTFVSKKNTPYPEAGYVNKMIKANEIKYSWIHIEWS